MITDWWGEQAGAGIDYFDIVRIFPTHSANSEKQNVAKRLLTVLQFPNFVPQKIAYQIKFGGLTKIIQDTTKKDVQP